MEYLFCYIPSAQNKIKMGQCYFLSFSKKYQSSQLQQVYQQWQIFFALFYFFCCYHCFLKSLNHYGLSVNQQNSTIFLLAERLFEINQSQLRILNYNVVLIAQLILMESALKVDATSVIRSEIISIYFIQKNS